MHHSTSASVKKTKHCLVRLYNSPSAMRNHDRWSNYSFQEDCLDGWLVHFRTATRYNPGYHIDDLQPRFGPQLLMQARRSLPLYNLGNKTRFWSRQPIKDLTRYSPKMQWYIFDQVCSYGPSNSWSSVPKYHGDTLLDTTTGIFAVPRSQCINRWWVRRMPWVSKHVVMFLQANDHTCWSLVGTTDGRRPRETI